MKARRALIFPIAALCLSACASDPHVILAADHGLKGDGVQDDGPAIQRSLEAARQVDGPVRIDFPENATIRVETGVERYAFWLTGERDLGINGNGSEFRLHPDLRFLNAFDCDRLIVANLQVDYTRQPTTPGTILAVYPEKRSIEVRLDHPDYRAHLQGPTDEDGEQDFFGMIELPGANGTVKMSHYYVERVESPGTDIIELFNEKANFNSLAKLVEIGKTRIGIPVSGVAHRHGPGGLFVINHNRNVLFQNIEVWSAPWFAFQIFRNEGRAIFRNVNVRPRPGSGKVLSACRDAFHAKGNRAELLFEDCELTGLGDDAFNVATHASSVTKVESAHQITVRQNFPIQYIPIREGDTLAFLDRTSNRLVAERVIQSVREVHTANTASRETRYMGRAPSVEIELAEPLDALEKGLIVWVRESASPQTTIRRCHIERSCRLMTSVMIEDSTIDAFVWFYGDHKEGPVPESIVVRNSRLRSNATGGDAGTAFSISGWNERKGPTTWEPLPENFPTKRVEFTNNEIWGKAYIRDALSVSLIDNQFFYENGDPLRLENCPHVDKSGNRSKKKGVKREWH